MNVRIYSSRFHLLYSLQSPFIDSFIIILFIFCSILPHYNLLTPFWDMWRVSVHIDAGFLWTFASKADEVIDVTRESPVMSLAWTACDTLIHRTGAAAAAVTFPLLCCLLHVYVFIEINCLIQGLVIRGTRLSINIRPGEGEMRARWAPRTTASSSRSCRTASNGAPPIAAFDGLFINAQDDIGLFEIQIKNSGLRRSWLFPEAITVREEGERRKNKETSVRAAWKLRLRTESESGEGPTQIRSIKIICMCIVDIRSLWIIE